jgi:hypothetical protein
LTNIELHRAFKSSGRNLTDLKPAAYDHIVELGPIKWNTAERCE